MTDSAAVYWSVYILKCSDNSFYTGSTNNVFARFTKHAQGKGAKYTRSRLPVTLHYEEVCENKSEALKREHAIKKLTRAEKSELISSHLLKNKATET